jgi:hypothetical protein
MEALVKKQALKAEDDEAEKKVNAKKALQEKEKEDK